MSMYVKGAGEDGLAGIAASFVKEAKADDALETTARIAESQETALQDQQDEANPLVAAFKRFDKKIQAQTSVKVKAKEAKLAHKKLIPKKEIEEGARQFKNANPHFLSDSKKLNEFANKLPDGATQEQLLELIHKEFSDPLQASLAWKFVMSVGLYDQETLDALDVLLNQEVLDSIGEREKEVAKKVEAEAASINQEASAAALKIVQGGDLNKLLEHLMINPLEAPAIFKMLDDAYGKDLRKIESYLLKKCGIEVNKLIKLEDHEDVAHMKNAMTLIKKLQAIIWVDRFFEIRNKPEQKVAEAGAPKRRT